MMTLEFFLPMLPPTATAQEHKLNARGKRPRVEPDSEEFAETMERLFEVRKEIDRLELRRLQLRCLELMP